MDTATGHYDVDIQDVEYLTDHAVRMLARLFVPKGAGPFPAVVDAHGGAWCTGDRTGNDPLNREIARRGVVVASLDFRNPSQATYPGSVVDVNFGIRWLKANAERFKSQADLVGAMGTSSGGHLVVLNGFKPNDLRYAARDLPGFDARIRYVVTLWPVICPLARFRHHGAMAAGEAIYGQKDNPVPMQQKFWLTEDAMAEGSPLLALESGETLEQPSILYVQHRDDGLHPAEIMDRFVSAYRERGGDIELENFGGERYDSVRVEPSSAIAQGVFDKIAAFIHDQTASSTAPRNWEDSQCPR